LEATTAEVRRLGLWDLLSSTNDDSPHRGSHSVELSRFERAASELRSPHRLEPLSSVRMLGPSKSPSLTSPHSKSQPLSPLRNRPTDDPEVMSLKNEIEEIRRKTSHAHDEAAAAKTMETIYARRSAAVGGKIAQQEEVLPLLVKHGYTDTFGSGTLSVEEEAALQRWIEDPSVLNALHSPMRNPLALDLTAQEARATVQNLCVKANVIVARLGKITRTAEREHKLRSATEAARELLERARGRVD
jgi:hypothetical protein